MFWEVWKVTVWNFSVSKSKNFGSLGLLSRNSEIRWVLFPTLCCPSHGGILIYKGRLALKCLCCGLNVFLEQDFLNQFLLPQHLYIVLKYLLFYLSKKVMRSCKILLKKWTCQKLPLSWKKVKKKTTEQVRSMCLKLLSF